MLLATYQPIDIDVEHRNPQYDCFKDKLGGDYPAFCIPMRNIDEFRFRSMLAAPAKPERVVFIETESYARFDAVIWNNILGLDESSDEFKNGFEKMFENVDERFSEYVVSSSLLENPVDEIELDELLWGEVDEEDKAEAGMYLFLQEKAQDAVSRGWKGEQGPKEDGTHDFDAILAMTAFIIYLSPFAYGCGRNSPVPAIDALPLSPDVRDSVALDSWNRFNELRWKVFDTKEGGTHSDYINMASAYVRALSQCKLDFAHHAGIGRNDECICGSGKKFKKCHGLKPINIFPFEE